MNTVATISHYTLIKIHGDQAQEFLQGQLTCDVKKIGTNYYSLTAYCDAKGRMWSIARLFQIQDDYFLFLPAEVAEETANDLNKYAKFSKMSVSIEPNYSALLVHSNELSTLLNKTLPDKAYEYSQLNDLTILYLQVNSYLVIGNKKAISELEDKLAKTEHLHLPTSAWDLSEIQMAIPTVWKETLGELLPHEVNLPELNGVSFTKGCYKGQEIIARMQYRGQRKKHMYLAHFGGNELPIPGSVITDEEQKKVGEVVSAAPNLSGTFELLAVLSNAAIDANQALFLNGHPITHIKLPI